MYLPFITAASMVNRYGVDASWVPVTSIPDFAPLWTTATDSLTPTPPPPAAPSPAAPAPAANSPVPAPTSASVSAAASSSSSGSSSSSSSSHGSASSDEEVAAPAAGSSVAATGGAAATAAAGGGGGEQLAALRDLCVAMQTSLASMGERVARLEADREVVRQPGARRAQLTKTARAADTGAPRPPRSGRGGGGGGGCCCVCVGPCHDRGAEGGAGCLDRRDGQTSGRGHLARGREPHDGGGEAGAAGPGKSRSGRAVLSWPSSQAAAPLDWNLPMSHLRLSRRLRGGGLAPRRRRGCVDSWWRMKSSSLRCAPRGR